MSEIANLVDYYEMEAEYALKELGWKVEEGLATEEEYQKELAKWNKLIAEAEQAVNGN